MTVTAIQPAAGDEIPGADFVTSAITMATEYAAHAGMPRPTPRMNIRVAPGTPGDRLAELTDIARRLRVEVTERDGVLYAERQFGGITVEAHLPVADDGSTNGWLLRAKTEAATAGSPAGETAALTARLEAWIGAERITGNYPAPVIAAILAETISGEYLAASLDKGGTPYLRDAARRVKHYADTTPDEDKAEARLAGVRA